MSLIRQTKRQKCHKKNVKDFQMDSCPIGFKDHGLSVLLRLTIHRIYLIMFTVPVNSSKKQTIQNHVILCKNQHKNSPFYFERKISDSMYVDPLGLTGLWEWPCKPDLKESQERVWATQLKWTKYQTVFKCLNTAIHLQYPCPRWVSCLLWYVFSFVPFLLYCIIHFFLTLTRFYF